MKKTISAILSIVFVTFAATFAAQSATVSASATEKHSQVLCDGYDIIIDDDIKDIVSYSVIDETGHITAVQEDEDRALRCCMTIDTAEPVTVNYETLQPTYNAKKDYTCIKVIFDMPKSWTAEETTTEQTTEQTTKPVETTTAEEIHNIPAPETPAAVVPETTVVTTEPETEKTTEATTIPETTVVAAEPEVVTTEKEAEDIYAAEVSTDGVTIPDININVPDVSLPAINLTVNKTDKDKEETTKAPENNEEPVTDIIDETEYVEQISAEVPAEVPNTGSSNVVLAVCLVLILTAMLVCGYEYAKKHENAE